MIMIATRTKTSHLPCFGKLVLAVTLAAFALASQAAAQQSFATPDAAAEALATAAQSGDRKAMLTVLGAAAADLVTSGDDVQDEETRKAFVAAYAAKHRVATEAGKPATLVIGQDDFPFPIPLVQKGDSWQFDAAAGRKEILARRIGRNELAAIQVCLAFSDAQNEYADLTPKANGLSVYAQRVVSSPGMKDGLYWPAAAGEPDSPIGEAVAEASQRGYKVGSGGAFHGYKYKMLTRQGAAAPGGTLDYIVKGQMIGGFAMIAWPAEYGNSGVTTFMISHSGDVYEKNLGPSTAQIASRTSSFNPDDSWKKVNFTEEKN